MFKFLLEPSNSGVCDCVVVSKSNVWVRVTDYQRYTALTTQQFVENRPLLVHCSALNKMFCYC